MPAGVRSKRRHARRRRLSVAHLDNSAIDEAKERAALARSSSGAATPSRKLGTNDDAAEKKRVRRNSIHHRRRGSVGIAIQGGGRRRRKSAAFIQEHVPKMDEDDLATMYSDVVTQSQKNKINKQNAWGLNLINYMSDVIKMQERVAHRGQPKLTDFARASHTIDAAAKIYGARVDSVHTESYKVLGSINHDEPRAEGQEGGAPGPDGKPRNRRRNRTAASTLVTTEARLKDINLQDLSDVCNQVDPMFHKTASAFDDASVRGLLMNQLGVMNGCKIAFDSESMLCTDISPLREDMLNYVQAESEDIRFDQGSDRPDTFELGKQDPPLKVSYKGKPRELVEVTDGGKTLILNEDAADQEGQALDRPESSDTLKTVWERIRDNISTLASCPGVEDFQRQIDGLGPAPARAMPEADVPMAEDDAEGGWDHDDGGFDAGGDDDFGYDDDNVDGPIDQAAIEEQMLNIELDNQSETNSVAGDNTMLNDTLDTFNRDQNKSYVSVIDVVDLDKCFLSMEGDSKLPWTGTEVDHNWIYKRRAFSKLGNKFNDPSQKSAKRKKKVVEFLDLSDIRVENLANIDDSAFDPPARGTGRKFGPVLSEAAQLKHHGNYNQLPTDLHLEPRMFARLFHRKRRRVINRREVLREVGGPEQNAGGFDAAGDNFADDDWSGGMMDNDDMGGHWAMDDDSDEEPFGAQQPFARQESFVHWDDGEVGFDFDNFGAMKDAPRIANTIKVDYVVKAKKIDVKKLKRNMWDCIGKQAKKADAPRRDQSDEKNDPQDAVDTSKNLTFQKALQNIADVQPKEQVDNLSVAFCFMCVLHLANEKNLTFDHAKEAFMGDFAIRISDEQREAVIQQVNQSMLIERNQKQAKLPFKGKKKGGKKAAKK